MEAKTDNLTQQPRTSVVLPPDLRKRLHDLELEAPVVPEGIYLHVEERYASVVFAERVATLVQ